MKFRGIVVFGIGLCLAAAVWAQAQPASQVPGTVTAVDASTHHLTIKSDKGGEMTVEPGERTVVVRVPPGETDPKKWVKIALSDLTPGDRIVAFTKQPIEGKVVVPSSIVVMSKADVAKEHEQEQEDWKKRGTTGNVAAVDAAAKTVTLKVGARTVTVKMSDKTDYHRYSLDSARFSDATASNFEAIKVGDQMKALGNKGPDGTVDAEKVVFGAFRQLAATIISINAATGEMQVKDLATEEGPALHHSRQRRFHHEEASGNDGSDWRGGTPGAQQAEGDGARAAAGIPRAGRQVARAAAVDAAAISDRCSIAFPP